MAATVEAAFRLNNRASDALADMRLQAERTQLAFDRLGLTMDKVGGTDRTRQLDATSKSIDRVTQSASKGNGVLSLFAGRWQMIGLAVTAGMPVLAQAAGVLDQLVASLAQAAGGAGVIGGGLLGAFAVGLGSVMAVFKTTQDDIKKATTQFDAYNRAVALYGANSAQANRQAAALNYTLKTAPDHTMQLVQANRQLSLSWDKVTNSAQGALVQLRLYAAQSIQSHLGPISKMVNANVGAFAAGGQSLIDRLLSPEMMSSLQRISAGFRRDIGPMIDAVGNLAVGFGRLIADAQPFATSFARGFDHLTQVFERWTQNTTHIHEVFRRMVSNFETWLKLMGAIIHLFATLVTVGRGGQSMVQAITDEINKWTDWLNNNPAKVARFFQQSSQFAGDLGHTLQWLFGLIAGFATTFTPIWDNVRQILASIAGPLMRLIQDASRTLVLLGQSLSVLGGASGPLALVFNVLDGIFRLVNFLIEHVPALGGLIGGPLLLLGVIKLATSFESVNRAIAAAVANMRGFIVATDTATSATERLAIAETGVASGGTMAGAGIGAAALASRGGVVAGSELTGVRAAAAGGEGLWLPAGVAGSATAAERAGLGSRLLGAGRTRLAGVADTATFGRLASAGRFARGAAGPVGLGLLLGSTAFSMIPASSLPGGRRTRNVLQGIGTGAMTGGMGGFMVGGLGGAGVGAVVGGLIGGTAAFFGGPGGPDAGQRALSGYNASQTVAGFHHRQGVVGVVPNTRMVHHAGLDEMLAASGGSNPQTAGQMGQEIQTYQHFINNLTRHHPGQDLGALAQLRQQQALLMSALPAQRQREQAQSFGRGTDLLSQYNQAFTIIQGAHGPVAAMNWVRTHMLEHFRSLGPAGEKVFGESMIKWADQMKARDPRFASAAKQIHESILDQFKKMHQNVMEVHHQLFQGTGEEWKNISKAMTDPAEQARQSLSTTFTLIQQQAVGSLMAMGYTKAQASQLVGGADAKGVAPLINTSETRPSMRHARGGRISGYGLQDNVEIAPGNLAAPGELVVNRHTESRADRLLASHGMTLGGLVQGETTPHSMAKGGRVAGPSGYVFPYPAGQQVGWRRIDQGQDFQGQPGGALLAIGSGTTTLAPPDPRGFGPDYPLLHLDAGPWMGRSIYYGHTDAARPLGQHAAGDVVAYSSRTGHNAPPGWAEIGFWPPGSMSAGNAIGPGLHALAAGARLAGGMGGGPLRQIGPLGLGQLGVGISGALLTAGAGAYGRGLRGRINAALAAQSGGAGAPATGGGPPSANEALAHQMMVAAGWGQPQWPALRSLWTGESGFSTTATNPSSGAYGIPQSLPASKMRSAGADYMTNPATQIKWGLDYIRSRYGSPSVAYAQWLARNPHWYEMGGRVPEWGGWHASGGSFTASRPTVIGVGERGPERVTVTPHGGGGASGGVRIGRIVVHNHREGDIQRQIEKEVGRAFSTFGNELTTLGMEPDEAVMA